MKITKHFVQNLKKKFANTYKFANQDINTFILLLQLGVYPYEYIDDWQEFNGKSLPEKKDYYNRLNMGDITKLMQTIFKTKKKKRKA